MSQEGGTYQPSSKMLNQSLHLNLFVHEPVKSDGKGHLLDKSDVGKYHLTRVNAPSHREPSKNTKCLGESTDDGQEWELVSIPDEGENDIDASTNRIESHFDFTVGWGQKKLTLLSWDLKYERQSNDKKEAAN